MFRRFLTAEWRHLLLLNYEIDREVLEPLVPAGTELDLWHGTALCSMVGFHFLNTRLLGVPIPFHRDFEEVNLRFYVRRPSAEGWRRGVVFVKEIVPKRAVTAVARWVYNENYQTCPMSSRIRLPDPARGQAGDVEYRWTCGGSANCLRASFAGSPAPAAPGSEEEFILEHYWGYTVQRNGSALEFEVQHPRWKVWQAIDARLDCDATVCYGSRYGAALGGRPVSAFLADGSEVSVYRGTRLPTVANVAPTLHDACGKSV